ncbi:putative polysaccharide biosynthesis protein [Brevibacillus fulvus]|uniref:PST family polysaccharide transporter n=1 Tax=Brevibacillus fulvus TaxID=1125967 RepID=A0A939BTU1_9BACL|nr:polysaccharide biosynthesis protein [Brevibacillus fulvus]MBM7592172.1 PST family polysaccharide transporter [Brevibacillus fulvus]
MSGARDSVHFVKGAAILGIAALVSKLLGAVYRIPYQNIAGDIGLYVYMQVYPLYTTLLILATAGFPLAISKMVSERVALGDYVGARKAFRLASILLVALGVLFFLILYIGAPAISRFMGDEQLARPLRAVSWALPLVPMAAILRGYFQGYQDMMPTGVSQVMEQLVRVVFILVSAFWAMDVYQDAYLAGMGAVFAAFPGALASILVLLYYWRRRSRAENSLITDEPSAGLSWSNREILRSLLYYALPICIGSLVLPLIPLVDSVTVVNLLQWSGMHEDTAKILKGAFDRGQPLIQFGTFFATSLSLALVPAVSEANAQKQTALIASRTEMALRLTLLLGLPASFGLFLLAEPINVMLFGDSKGTDALAIQSYTILFATLGITTAGILQGLGQVVAPARNLFVGVVAKLLFNLLLVPVIGIAGAACATVIAYAISMLLNMLDIHKHTKAVVSYRQVLGKPFLAVIIMVVAVGLTDWIAAEIFGRVIGSQRMQQTAVGLVSVLAGGLVYFLALLKTGGISVEDLHYLPKGKRVGNLLSRFNLLKNK